MTNATQQFSAVGKSNVETFENVASQMLAGAEQLSHLNLAVAKAALAESFEHMQSLMSVRDPQQFIALQAGMLQPMAEKTVSYGRQVYEIVSTTGADIAKVSEGKMAEAQQSLMSAVDNAMKNAPAGSEAAVAMFKSAFSASQDAINTAQNAARQVVTTAESNMASMSDQASNTAKAAAKKR